MNPMHRKNKNRLNDHSIPRRLRRSFALYAAIMAACCLAMPVLADGDPLTVINNLSTFIFSVIRAIGLILLVGALSRSACRCKAMTPASAARAF